MDKWKELELEKMRVRGPFEKTRHRTLAMLQFFAYPKSTVDRLTF
jgi:hypothetical protein